MRKSKIVATLGPATETQEQIEQLIEAGVDVFRLNFSHATHQYHQLMIDKIRNVSKKLHKEVAILQDIAGPKIRISHLDAPIHLQKGDILTFSKENVDLEHKIIGLSYPQIIDSVEVGEMIYISDGNIRVKVIAKDSDSLRCEVMVANILQSKKGVNFPNSCINIDSITQKDIKDLTFGAAQVDLVAISFVRDAKDIVKAKQILRDLGHAPEVFAKIETPQAVANIDAILEVSDGVMVARGDMGVELGVHKVPPIQKMIVKKANALCKPVIIATQMLTSMIDSPYPTRAEMSDVANAVLDGADALMLSDETTIGKYPVEVIKVLQEAIIEAETIYPYYQLTHDIEQDQSVVASAAMMSKNLNPDALVVFTRGGTTAKYLSKFRTDKTIFASSYNVQTQRKLKVVWGVEPICISQKFDDSNELQYNFIKNGLAEGVLDLDKRYIFTFSYPLGSRFSTNVIRVMDRESFEYLIEKFEAGS
ncbi:MAG: pyruvate kinase [Campylobacterota bacterium]